MCGRGLLVRSARICRFRHKLKKMKLSELCAMLKSYIADNASVANYEIGHADFGAVNQSSIVLHLFSFKTPTKWAVMSDEGVAY